MPGSWPAAVPASSIDKGRSKNYLYVVAWAIFIEASPILGTFHVTYIIARIDILPITHVDGIDVVVYRAHSSISSCQIHFFANVVSRLHEALGISNA